MNRNHLIAAVIATSLAGWSVPSEAQARREPSRSQVSRSVEQIPQQRSRSPDLYAVEPGRTGTITATTPNQWGNFGAQRTGGGSGGSP